MGRAALDEGDAMTEDLAEVLAAQARELFDHLPPAELEEDAELMFRTDAQGRLQVVAGPVLYCLVDGAAWACRRLPGRMVAVEAWRAGELVNRATMAEETLLGGPPAWN